jgi:hypothetical protein
MKFMKNAAIALAIFASVAHAQRVPDPATLPRHQLAAQAKALRPTSEPNEAELQ